MVQVSIEMITKGETTTKRVLKSISEQTFRDYDVTCVNSSDNPMITELLKEYGVNEVRVKSHTKALEARYLAHTNSSGKFRLLLDSSRPLEE
ncbi:glycosyl transferase family protein, partial [mine drainage metagenome]